MKFLVGLLRAWGVRISTACSRQRLRRHVDSAHAARTRNQIAYALNNRAMETPHVLRSKCQRKNIPLSHDNLVTTKQCTICVVYIIRPKGVVSLTPLTAHGFMAFDGGRGCHDQTWISSGLSLSLFQNQ